MDGGGQGPAGADAKGCFASPQGYTYHYGTAQPCTGGSMWGNDDGRTCDAGGGNSAESWTCPCKYGVCPAGYKMNKGIVPQGWNEWGSRRRYP